jgi:threonine dehydrogenase-like Zn-dependent dehydrogenase
MWAQRLVAPRTFEPVEVDDLTASDLRPGEVLLRTITGAICGSDLPVYLGGESLARPDGAARAAHIPGFPMHEIVGEVVASVDGGHEVGTRVVGWATSHRAIAELVVTRGDAVAPYDADLRPDQAILLQTLACVLDSVDKCPDPSGIDRAAVLGLGPIGLLFAHVLKSRGARVVTGVDLVDRSAVAATFGLDEVHHSATSRWRNQVKDADRPDLVVEAVGHQTQTLVDALETVAPHGFVHAFGVPDVAYYPLPLDRMLRNNITLFAGFAHDRQAALASASAYLRDHPELRDVYVTHRYPVSDVGDAFEAAATPRPAQIKIAVQLG